MKRLDKCVNIIPVIAKSDTLTLEEREAFKRRVSKIKTSSKCIKGSAHYLGDTQDSRTFEILFIAEIESRSFDTFLLIIGYQH